MKNKRFLNTLGLCFMSQVFTNAEIIGKLEISPTADLVFSVSTFKGAHYANIRKFQHTERYNGPTKSGLALRLHLLEWLISELSSIQNEVPKFQETEIARTSKRQDTDMIIQMVPPRDPEGLVQLDIREYVKSERYSGPTKKGIRFGIDTLPQVLGFLKAQADKIRELNRSQRSLFKRDQEHNERVKIDQNNRVNIDQVVSQILPDGPEQFPDYFLSDKKGPFDIIHVPPEPIRLGQLSGRKQQVVSEMGFLYEAKNLVEGKYIVYAHMAGNRPVKIPEKPFEVFRTVKQYEIYVRGIQKSLIDSYYKRTGHIPTAEHLARSAFKKLGLPWLST